LWFENECWNRVEIGKGPKKAENRAESERGEIFKQWERGRKAEGPCGRKQVLKKIKQNLGKTKGRMRNWEISLNETE